jgi:hypothetical protein
LGEKKPKEAIWVLEAIYPKHTGDREIVGALAYYYRQVGDMEKSSEYEKMLKSLQNFSVR